MKIHSFERLRSWTSEDIAVSIFCSSFFIGIWYAMPMVNTIVDVWAFGGGVLRAMEAHTIFPGSDVSYGTISFFINYVAMSCALFFGFLFTGFDFEALKEFLILNPSYTLIPSRIISVLTTILFVYIVHRFLRMHIMSPWWRFALIVLTFGSVLSALLARSGKMWMLSTMLGVCSCIYVYRALTEERNGGAPGRLSFTSIVTAFLATANFPFAAVFLINIPILFLFFEKTRVIMKRLFCMVLWGLLIFCGVVATNFENTVGLVWSFVDPFFQSTAPSHTLSFIDAFRINVRQILESFPLMLLALVFVLLFSKRPCVRDRTMFYLAIVYGVVYTLAASIVFRADHGLALNVRHIFPVAFFLLFIIVAFYEPRKYVAMTFVAIGLALSVYTTILFALPTTYNDASNYIESVYAHKPVRIDEHILELTLPTNRASYMIHGERQCGSTCRHRREIATDIVFQPLVVTEHTDRSLLKEGSRADIAIHEMSIPGCSPIAYFGNNIPDTAIFDIDINLGRILMKEFFMLNQLGKNIYIYDVASCPMSAELVMLQRKTHPF